MTIEEMLRDVDVLDRRGPADIVITGVTNDSRLARAGCAFVAVKGLKTDGMAYVPQAIAAGAACVVVGRGRAGEARRAGGDRVAVVEVEDERKALALIGRNVHGRPDLEMSVIGVTGTNGKTTTTYLLSAIWEAAGIPCGVIGTIECRLGGDSKAADRTTPEAPEIHAWLRRMRDGGAGACAMEVSSHALHLRRAHGIRFAAAVFTNLTRDHLDYHGDMESYYRAKRILFESLPRGAPSILNADDASGRRLATEAAARPILYGEAGDADYRLLATEGGLEGLRLRIAAEGSEHSIESPLVGRPNAYNLLAAIAASRALGIPWEAVRRGALAMRSVRGRLERVEEGQPFKVVIDYAHTDDALSNVLAVLRPLTPGRLITVFGCGGDRDRTKRPLMGAHAARLSDLAFATSDNPRTEDPLAIIAEVVAGVKGVPGGEARVRVEPDRSRAIRSAIREALPGDTVLIAGKGHETYQIFKDRTIHFDDAEVARRFIEERLREERGDAAGDAS